MDANAPTGDRWVAGDAYEAYMGRWSRRLAREFVGWLRPAPSAHWLELGCGTGALTAAICELGDPASVTAVEPSAPFVEYARAQIADARVSFMVPTAGALPRRDDGFGAAVSGLVLNFLPDPERAVESLRERLRPGGTVAAYVWDYADGMECLRLFWEEAVALDPRARTLDERRRFPLCEPSALASLFRHAGLADVETGALTVPTEFATFRDFWTPFLRGTGPAPSYVVSLDPHSRDRLRDRLERRLDTDGARRISLRARAWAVRGVSP
jgi:SAM-dependent methyltransferase